MIDARRMEVFSAIYSPSMEVLKNISADVLEDDSYLSFKELVLVGDGAEKTQELFVNRDYTYDLSLKSSVVGLFESGYDKFVRKDFEDVAYFEPFYLKEFFTTAKKV